MQVVALHQEARKFRVEIRHLEGVSLGKEENVPRGRLKVLWKDVVEYDTTMDGWGRLRAESPDECESSALWAVHGLVVPSAVAELFVSSVDDALTVHDQTAFEALTGRPVSAFQAEFSWMIHDGEVCLSPRASASVVELACRRNSGAVLDLVMAEETEAREKSKRGGQIQDWETRELVDTSAEFEYEYYLRRKRPIHDILRQWCGYQSVTAYERLLAAEAEVNRLDVLLAWAVDYVRRNDESMAAMIEKEHEGDRITPYNIRPVAQRPLQPHEIPHIEIPARRRWRR